MLTPQQIQDLADPIESIYISMTNELMVNIGRHITSPTWTHTAAWEVQKLSELGQLTAENAAIINNWIAQIPDEIRETMEETRRIALEGIEQDLSKAADKGYLTPPMRDSTYDVLNEYGQQAADKLNMVNTTMLESSVEMYKRGIAMVMSEEQAAAAQNILNEETGAVVSGTETRTQALQRAIGRMNDEGITGFYDRAGRSWSAEAYVNMDIRTTVHNTAIQSVKNRMNDYGAQVFQVSAHAGARPLCYPYQGKMFSWDNTAGEIEDGNGKRWKYAPLNSTSYGQAAGLFGVNCGHSPIPIIPGVSIPHAQDYVQPKSENDKAYAESQEQRALERKIRNAKRAIEMGDDSPEAKQRLKDAQKDMRQFIDETGRTRRYDRESLYSGKKAPTPPADQRPQNNKEASNGAQYKSFGNNGEAANEYFGKRPERKLRRENPEEYKRQMEQYKSSMYGSWSEKLSGDQVAAIGYYSGDYYSGINGLLRGQVTSKMADAWQLNSSQTLEEMVHNIDSAISTFELKEPIRVYRTCDERMIDRLSGSVGGTFKDDGYVSTSAISDKVASGNVVLEIDIPPGINHGAWINPISGAEDTEYEFLLPRGSEFKVKEQYKRGEDTVFVMEFIGSSPEEVKYASKEDVIKYWKEAGIYDEKNASKI